MIISVINQKGGVGKTTTAVSLASRFAKMEKKTLIVDLDPQANATVSLSLFPQEEPFKIERVSDYLNILPSSPKLSFLEASIAVDYVRKMLIGSEEEFIIIDSPPVLNNLSINAVSAAEFLIIPVLSGDFYSLIGLKDIFSTIHSVNPDAEYKVLLTNVNERLAITAHFIKKLSESVGKDNIFSSCVRIDSKLKEAPFAGMPIDLYAQNSKGSLDYGDLALEILNLKEV